MRCILSQRSRTYSVCSIVLYFGCDSREHRVPRFPKLIPCRNRSMVMVGDRKPLREEMIGIRAERTDRKLFFFSQLQCRILLTSYRLLHCLRTCQGQSNKNPSTYTQEVWIYKMQLCRLPNSFSICVSCLEVTRIFLLLSPLVFLSCSVGKPLPPLSTDSSCCRESVGSAANTLTSAKAETQS